MSHTIATPNTPDMLSYRQLETTSSGQNLLSGGGDTARYFGYFLTALFSEPISSLCMNTYFYVRFRVDQRKIQEYIEKDPREEAIFQRRFGTSDVDVLEKRARADLIAAALRVGMIAVNTIIVVSMVIATSLVASSLGALVGAASIGGLLGGFTGLLLGLRTIIWIDPKAGAGSVDAVLTYTAWSMLYPALVIEPLIKVALARIVLHVQVDEKDWITARSDCLTDRLAYWIVGIDIPESD